MDKTIPKDIDARVGEQADRKMSLRTRYGEVPLSSSPAAWWLDIPSCGSHSFKLVRLRQSSLLLEMNSSPQSRPPVI